VQHPPGVAGDLLVFPGRNIRTRASLAQRLRDAGFRVLEASNAGEAIEILHSGDNVDAPFTDVRMSHDNEGIRLAQWIGHNHPAVRVVFGSGERNLGGIVPGARPFSKPCDFDEGTYIRGLLADLE
jgi:DNA-binding NtrC family response regulator